VKRRRGSTLKLATALGAALAAAACKPTPVPQPAPVEQAATPLIEGREDLPEEQRSPDLFGAWLVERVEAPDPALQDRSWDMILLVGVRQLEVLSQCVTIGPFDYGRTEGGGIAIRQPSTQPSRPRPSGKPAPVIVQCARALSPAEQALPRIFFAATDVERVGQNAISISGPSGALLLRRPSGALRNPRGQSPAPRTPLLLGAWRLVSIDGRAVQPAERVELLLRPRHLEWRSGCVHEVKELQVEGYVLHPGETEPFPVCERGRSEAERSLGKLFKAAVTADMMENGALTLHGSGVAAAFQPLTN